MVRRKSGSKPDETHWPHFSGLLSPIKLSDFMAEHWQQRPLLIRATDPGRFALLLTLTHIDELLTQRRLGPSRIRMAKGGGSTLEAAAFTRPDGSFDPSRGIKVFLDGGTLILNHLHLDIPQLTSFCQDISDELKTEMQCNVYVTPAVSQGFPVHYDTHDVFIAQAHGSKLWKLYDSPLSLPLAGQPHDTSGATPGRLSVEIELSEGDVLYIPRGYYHEASTSECMSVHLTFGLMAKSWSELLLETVSCAALELNELRAAPYPGYGMNPASELADRDALISMIDRVNDFVRSRSMSEILQPQVLYPRTRTMAGRFMDLVLLADLSVTSLVALRPDLAPVLKLEGDQTVVVSDDVSVFFPARVQAALVAALIPDGLRVGDLPDCLDDDGKILMVRKLIENGILGFMQANRT